MYRLRFNIILLVLWVASVVGGSFYINFGNYWDMSLAVLSSALLIIIIGRTALHRLVLPFLFIAYSLILIVGQLVGQSPTDSLVYITPVVAIVKLLVLTLTIIQAQRLVYEMVDFEDSVTNLSLDLAGLPPRMYQYDLEEVYREVRRARRFDQPLTMAVVRPDYSAPTIDLNRISAELLTRLKNRYLQIKLMERWSIDLSDSDIVVREGNEFILAFPNTSAEKVQSMLKEYETFTGDWGLPLDYGISSMPDEAFTYAKLIDHARQQLDNEDSDQTGTPDQLQPVLAS